MVVTVFAEDAGDGRKRSSKIHRKSSSEARCRTSALDLGGYERRLGKRIVLLESTHRGLHRHIYIHTQGLEILESGDILGIIDFHN